jgi:phosphatidylglycerophosphatase A
MNETETAVTASAKTIFTDPIHFLAFGFGSGLSPIAPGTVGTLAVIPIYLLMQPLSLFYYGVLVLFITLIGIWICGESSKRLGVHDHKGIVWDEFAGYLITMFAAPFAWQWIIIGFLLFRLFDIWKPWPIRPIDENLGGGLGIMLDDVLAGVFAAIILQILIGFS